MTSIASEHSDENRFANRSSSNDDNDMEYDDGYYSQSSDDDGDTEQREEITALFSGPYIADFAELQNYALTSKGASIKLGRDYWFDEFTNSKICKTPYRATFLQNCRSIVWRTPQETLLLMSDRMFPDKFVCPDAMDESDLIKRAKELNPEFECDTVRSTFLDRVSCGRPSTLTVKLFDQQLISAIGVTFTPYDRHCRDSRVEVGMYEETEFAPLHATFSYPNNEPMLTDVGILQCPELSLRGRKSRNAYLTFEPRWADSVRLKFNWEGARIVFLYVLGPKKLWLRFGWLIKRLALVQAGRATIKHQAEVVLDDDGVVLATQRDHLKACCSSASPLQHHMLSVSSKQQQQQSDADELSKLLQLLVTFGDTADASFQLSPVLSIIFSFL